jgi:protein-L-isoaspartate(D-aspartate) O-methyltransferase
VQTSTSRRDVQVRQASRANAGRLVLLRGEDVALRVDADQAVDADALRDALNLPRVVRESGVEIGGLESFDELDLFLATALDDFGLLAAKLDAIEGGLVERSARMGAKTALAGGSFAYRASQATSEDRTSFEFVAYGHGRDGEGIADEYVTLIREWDRVHRHGPGARIEVFPGRHSRRRDRRGPSVGEEAHACPGFLAVLVLTKAGRVVRSARRRG